MQINSLTSLGYSEKASKEILFSMKKDYLKTIKTYIEHATDLTAGDTKYYNFTFFITFTIKYI